MLTLVPAMAGAADPDIAGRVYAAYPGVLATWAEGETQPALEKLDALETPLIRPGKVERDVEELWRAKLGVIREILERGSVELLVPIMLLHHDAYRHYAGQRATVLARHSLVMSSELAEVYAERSGQAAARRTASDLLTSLGGWLQSGFVTTRSAELLARALAVDPGNAAAHLGLGALYERRGELAEAAQHYAAAARFEPGCAEALLRQAVCVARGGEPRLAEPLLDRALAIGEPEWVARFAVQEKARLQEDPLVAAAVAREGRKRFPESSRQAIQLALLLDRQRQSRSALAVLDEISGRPEPESERYHYAHWPGRLLDAARARLRQAAADQNGVLAVATRSGEPMLPAE